MNESHYRDRNVELSLEFDLFAIEHSEWMAAHVPNGAIVVLQTDDPDFNAWARRTADHVRESESPPRPLVLVHIRELRPATSRIVRADAELVSALA